MVDMAGPVGKEHPQAHGRGHAPYPTSICSMMLTSEERSFLEGSGPHRFQLLAAGTRVHLREKAQAAAFGRELAPQNCCCQLHFLFSPQLPPTGTRCWNPAPYSPAATLGPSKTSSLRQGEWWCSGRQAGAKWQEGTGKPPGTGPYPHMRPCKDAQPMATTSHAVPPGSIQGAFRQFTWGRCRSYARRRVPQLSHP